MKRSLGALSFMAVVAAAACFLIEPAAYMGILRVLPGRDWKTTYLIELMNNPRSGWRARQNAAREIRRQGPDSERRAFYDMLAADAPLDDVLHGILSDLGDEAVPLLRRGLEDGRPRVRKASALWLEKTLKARSGLKPAG